MSNVFGNWLSSVRWITIDQQTVCFPPRLVPARDKKWCHRQTWSVLHTKFWEIFQLLVDRWQGTIGKISCGSIIASLFIGANSLTNQLSALISSIMSILLAFRVALTAFVISKPTIAFNRNVSASNGESEIKDVPQKSASDEGVQCKRNCS